jgi:hypothetical protein
MKIKGNKFILGLLIVISCLSIVGCSTNTTTNIEKAPGAINEDEKIGIRGIVKDIVDGKDGYTFLVEGSLEEDTQYDKATVTVNRDTKILKNGVDSTTVLDYTEIKEGNTVEVVFNGPVNLSDPVMGVAKNIKIFSSN